MRINKQLRIICIVGLSGFLNSCGVYPRLLEFPFDAGGRSLNSPFAELNPQISGNYVVFVSDRNGSQDIYLYDTFNRRLLNLPGLNSLDEIAFDPSVSEDGRYIVFTTSREGRSSIYLYDRDTQQKRNLTENISAPVRHPIISADGSRIALEIANEGQWDLRVITITGMVIK
jgi:beta propeller repeat protein